MVDPSHEMRVRRFVRLVGDAGIEFARGMIGLATGECEVPARVQPYERELAPLVDALRAAIAAGSFDEEQIRTLILR